MSLKDILHADVKSLIKLFCFFIVLVLAVGPGALLLFLEQRTEVLSANVFVLLGISAILSIPFHFLGSIVYLHPYKTLTELARKSQWELAVNVVAGIGLWSLLSAAGTYALVHGVGDRLSTASDIRIKYIVTYAVIFAPFGALFWFNTWRLKRALKNR